MNNKIQSLWIGNSLSIVEILCLTSFVKNGYDFDLYHYDPIVNLPSGVKLKDANEILPKDQIFQAHNGYAIFSDYFRIVLLNYKGGMWVDMDVMCLKRFDFEDDIVIGFQAKGEICNAVMQFPPLSALGKSLLERCEQPWLHESKENVEAFERIHSIKISNLLEQHGNEYTRRYCHINAPWGEIAGPYGLTKVIEKMNLMSIIKPIDFFYPVHYSNWWSIFYDNAMNLDDLGGSYTLHLWGQCFRDYKHFRKNDFQEGSIMHNLLLKYS
jgi:hypothetical protein